jgi:peptidoglycan-N-acetylglucosamine deacetylase
MLNFRTASIYMVILAVAGILLMITDIRYGWLLAALAAVYIYLLVMGSLKICSGFYMDVSCRGGSEEKVIALTFDDGPDINHTPQILEILEKHQVRATFFVIGSKAEKQENILRQIVSQGAQHREPFLQPCFLLRSLREKKDGTGFAEGR